MTTLRWSNGDPAREYPTVEAAKAAVERRHPAAVYAEEADRILAWADEDDAGPEGAGDDGSRAVAEIITAD